MINITILKAHENDRIFEESALCLRNSIRLLGLPCEIHTNAVAQSGLSIFFGGGLSCSASVFRQVASKEQSVIFNLEQLESHTTVVTSEYLSLLSEYRVLDYHSSNVTYLNRAYGKQNSFEIPLVPCFDLVNTNGQYAREAGDVQESDFLFYGSLNARRLDTIKALLSLGYKVEVITNGVFGSGLTDALRRTKCVLHIHYHETALFPIARFLKPMVMGIPIICENSIFSHGSDFSASGILFGPYERLAELCQEFLTSKNSESHFSRKTLHCIGSIIGHWEHYWGAFMHDFQKG